MVITSHDEIDEVGHVITGLFHVVMDVVHNNYGWDPDKPVEQASLRQNNQVIRLEFHNAQDIFCDLNAAYMGNTIMNITVHAANRRRGGVNPVETCLALRLARQYYYREQRLYELRESQVFTFSEATFTEQPT